MQFSDHVLLTLTVPETHADIVREAMGRAGAGQIGNYSSCSFSQKVTGRFKAEEGSNPFIGNQGSIEEVAEEKIETLCATQILDHVLKEIKKVHPYEEPVIFVQPLYKSPR